MESLLRLFGWRAARTNISTSSMRRKLRTRAAVPWAAFLIVCVVLADDSFLLIPHHDGDDRFPAAHNQQRRSAASTTELLCSDIETADPAWLLAFYLIGILYMFLAVAIVCDEFFVPALEEMSSERHLNLSTDVAGATLMAAGGSAPEFFSNMFGTFTNSAIGFGTIVGSAVFNVLFVIAMCAIFSKEQLNLTWWPLFRDSAYYAMGLSVLATFVGGTTDGKIVLWEAIVLFVLYIGYIILMYFNKALYKRLTGKELVILEQNGVEVELPAVDTVENGENERHPPERGLDLHRTGISQLSLASVTSILRDGDPSPRESVRPGTFRAGILKLLRDPDSWVETAGVGIVARIAGDADHIFHKVDLNNDGFVSRHELERLFERLDYHLTSEELDEVFSILDENKDGKVGTNLVGQHCD